MTDSRSTTIVFHRAIWHDAAGEAVTVDDPHMHLPAGDDTLYSITEASQ